MSGRVPLYLHVGLPKSGTTFLQALLADNRTRLKQAGFIYPFLRRECMFHAAVELRGQHERWGLTHELIDGTWEQLLDRVRQFGGAGVISHELLAGAGPRAIRRVARDTADLDLHVVVTARDLGRQVTAYWQEEVKNGRQWSFESFRRRVVDDAGAKTAKAAFWRTQDLTAVLARWAEVVPAPNVHVVVVPPPGPDRWELWRRFAAALALDPGDLDLDLHPRANESLGAAQVALLRQVNAALGGRLGQPHYAHVVKRFFAQGQLTRVPGARAVLPADLSRHLDAIAVGWSEDIRRHGWSVHGDLADLRPRDPGTEGAPHPDAVTAEQMLEGLPDVLAAMLLEIAELRTEITGPKQLPPLSGDAGR